LHETLSTTQHSFYTGLPDFPYSDATYEYIRSELSRLPDLRLAITWFRLVSGDYLNLRFASADPRRVQVVQVPMRESLLCPECP